MLVGLDESRRHGAGPLFIALSDYATWYNSSALRDDSLYLMSILKPNVTSCWPTWRESHHQQRIPVLYLVCTRSWCCLFVFVIFCRGRCIIIAHHYDDPFWMRANWSGFRLKYCFVKIQDCYLILLLHKHIKKWQWSTTDLFLACHCNAYSVLKFLTKTWSMLTTQYNL